VLFRKKLSRGQFLRFMGSHPAAIVVLEACGSAHHWARELMSQCHAVKLIAPQYMRPFVKRQKNDAADAEAIVIAARQPEMRFVEPKAPDQQVFAAMPLGEQYCQTRTSRFIITIELRLANPLKQRGAISFATYIGSLGKMCSIRFTPLAERACRALKLHVG
jgi:hypothetical protein